MHSSDCFIVVVYGLTGVSAPRQANLKCLGELYMSLKAFQGNLEIISQNNKDKEQKLTQK